jgi:hypothetical protein
MPLAASCSTAAVAAAAQLQRLRGVLHGPDTDLQGLRCYANVCTQNSVPVLASSILAVALQ